MGEVAYRTVVADPPWKYTDGCLWQHQASRASNHYDTLGIEHICRMNIPTADDAYLWLRITNRHLWQGSGAVVSAAWGFRPLTVMTWIKDRLGMGYYLRNCTEHLVFAVKGSPGQLDDKTIRTHFTSKPGKHSEKPSDLYEIVERACGGPYLELFGRKERKGWDVWGDEVGDPIGVGFDPKEW